MAYRLHNELWFCRIRENLVFLDVREDRYFRLPPSQERALISYLDGGQIADFGPLVGRKPVDALRSTEPFMQVRTIQNPVRSALEQSPAAPGLPVGLLLDVLAAITSALLRLKTRSLQDTLANILCYRARRTPPSLPCLDDTQEIQRSEAARSFARARLFIPVEPSCLLDSIALAKFLARRNMNSTVVFGVTCNPFSAHSWVQAGDMVLNDSVGNTRSYTPIGIF